ncbi:ribonuclease H-like domain-containing protein [Tanacetum coccineum]
MHYKDTFPDLKTAQSLLITEEMRLKSKSLSLPVDSSSASPMVLMAETGTPRRLTNPQVKSWRPCFNFARGQLGLSNKMASTSVSESSKSPTVTNSIPVAPLQNLPNLSPYFVAYNATIRPNFVPHSLYYVAPPGPPLYQAPTYALTLGYYLNPPLGKIRALEQKTRDLDDFMTGRVLLRCDSTGDLYPVTTPSPIPQAFLVSQHTWHQRLGHPGSEVLRRLVSSNFIPCNKEKPLILCHAYQLGKHSDV